MKNIKERGMLCIPLIVAVTLFGGFYSFTAYFVGALILLMLFIQLGRRKKSRTAFFRKTLERLTNQILPI